MRSNLDRLGLSRTVGTVILIYGCVQLAVTAFLLVGIATGYRSSTVSLSVGFGVVFGIAAVFVGKGVRAASRPR